MKKSLLTLIMAFAIVAVSAQEWKPVGDNIRTPWAEQLDPSDPLPE